MDTEARPVTSLVKFMLDYSKQVVSGGYPASFTIIEKYNSSVNNVTKDSVLFRL